MVDLREVSKRLNPDVLFERSTLFFALTVVIVFLTLLVILVRGSELAMKTLSIDLFSSIWDPNTNRFGVLPLLFGTLYTSTLALVLATILGLGASIYLVEMAPRSLVAPLSTLIDLIASIPSVVIGLWGIFVLGPFLKRLNPIYEKLSFLPFLEGRMYSTLTYLTATIVLTIMILPIFISVAREVLAMVPSDLKEAMYSLGARRYEVILKVSIPMARRGILGGLILAYGRALGETMAVAMTVGSIPAITTNLLHPGYTMAAALANEFVEASSDLYLSSLIFVGLVLFLVSATVSAIGRAIILRWSR